MGQNGNGGKHGKRARPSVVVRAVNAEPRREEPRGERRAGRGKDRTTLARTSPRCWRQRVRVADPTLDPLQACLHRRRLRIDRSHPSIDRPRISSGTPACPLRGPTSPAGSTANEQAALALAATAMLPLTRNASPPNIFCSVSPGSSRQRASGAWLRAPRRTPRANLGASKGSARLPSHALHARRSVVLLRSPRRRRRAGRRARERSRSAPARP